jgi:tyrosine aminotransferase
MEVSFHKAFKSSICIKNIFNRLGWIIVHDRHGALEEIKKGLFNLSARILGPNSLVQGALPKILRNTPQKFYDGLVETLQNHANIAFQMLKEIKGIKPIMPQGAMRVK